MDIEIADTLREVNNRFYRRWGASFSATRQGAWLGWERCVELLRECAVLDSERLSVCDVACGNGRFLAFLERALPDVEVEYWGVDGEVAFACDNGQELDLVAALSGGDGQTLSELLEAPACDLVVCFGFLHHVPLRAQREQLLAALAQQARPGGFVVVSFWQFLRDAGLRERAADSDRQARAELGLPKLDEGDYLLGWQNEPGAWRYCHSFTDDEVDRLVAAVTGRAQVVGRFQADGRGAGLNSYVVLRAC